MNKTCQTSFEQFIEFEGQYYRKPNGPGWGWESISYESMPTSVILDWKAMDSEVAVRIHTELLDQKLISKDPQALSFSEEEVKQYLWWAVGDFFKLGAENPNRMLHKKEIDEWWDNNCYEKP